RDVAERREHRRIEARARLDILYPQTDMVEHSVSFSGKSRKRIYAGCAMRSWKILRSPFAARRKARGETPAARRNVRTKLERSAKPTSRAMSVMERASSASSRAA